jgi:flavin reductase (DIM6/NTAB) family NADH-FMN oxidoreductase RutF
VSVGSDLDPFLAGLDYPMFVVTATHRETGSRAGCLVGFATQCSLEPDRFLACVSQANYTYRVAMHADVLAVHGLDPAQRELAALFGAETGDEVDKFERCSWRPGPSGVPILTDVPRHFIGEILDRFPLGNHTGFLLKPREAVGDPARPPLMFSAVSELKAGHDA